MTTLRTLFALAAIVPFVAAPTSLRDCQTDPSWEEQDFALAIDTCTVTLDGRTTRQDIQDVWITVGDLASQVWVYLPVDCLNGQPFMTEVNGTHVDLHAGLGCGTVDPDGSSSSAWLDLMSFEGSDLDGDGAMDHLEGVVTLGWSIEQVVGPMVVYSERVECQARPFVGDPGVILDPSTPVEPPTPVF